MTDDLHHDPVLEPADPREAAIDTLARTIWGEAATEGERGMRAVACVVLTRATHPSWWGHDVVSVCRAPRQFSCWNMGDPQFPRLRAVTAADPVFALAVRIATDALAGRAADETGGADSYANLALCRPSWAAGRTPTAVIGHHTFFRLQVRGPAVPAAPAARRAPACRAPASPQARLQPVLSDADRLNQAQLDQLRSGDRP